MNGSYEVYTTSLSENTYMLGSIKKWQAIQKNS